MSTLPIGTRIYYTGDCTNHAAFGNVLSINIATRVGDESMNLGMDDGNVMRGIPASYFGADSSSRFWTFADWKADRAARIADMETQFRQLKAQNDLSHNSPSGT